MATYSHIPQSVRYLIITATGVGLDLAIGWTLSAAAGVPVSVAALVGFLTAAYFNYLLHERWTFAVSPARAGAQRGVLYAAVLTLTLAVRMLMAALIQQRFAFPPENAIYALVPAIGISWCVNFALSKFVVFRSCDSPNLGSSETLECERSNTVA